MLAQPVQQKKSAFKNPFLYSWAALAIAALVVCGILFSRWLENRTLEKRDRKSTRLNSSHSQISYAVFCLKKKKKKSTSHSTVISKKTHHINPSSQNSSLTRPSYSPLPSYSHSHPRHHNHNTTSSFLILHL